MKKYTPRGFRNYGKQKDSNGVPFCVRESSSAMMRAVWLFVDDPDFRKPIAGGTIGPALHLSVGQAKRLVAALNKFIEEK